jgi:ABC-type dipeptide/oligopeptide/nickel transport system permease component
VQAVVMLFALLYIGINIVTDIVYAYVDPRIRY